MAIASTAVVKARWSRTSARGVGDGAGVAAACGAGASRVQPAMVNVVNVAAASKTLTCL